MGTQDPRVDAYIERSADFARPILNHLRALVHKAIPDVTETIKWGMPSFERNGTIGHMGAFKSHAVFGFRKAPLMTRSLHLFVDGGMAMGSFGRLTSKKDLPADKDVKAALLEAVELNEKGVKTPRTRTGEPKPDVKPPSDFKKALDANPSAKAHFKAFAPGKRRDYIEWITDAKTDATRNKRIAEAVSWIAEGKSRNWKYEKKTAS